MIKFVESPTQSVHTWIDMEETKNGHTYVKTAGMITPVIEGYRATTSSSEEETFKTFNGARDFIIDSAKKTRLMQ